MTLTVVVRPVVVLALRIKRTTVSSESNSRPWHARLTGGKKRRSMGLYFGDLVQSQALLRQPRPHERRTHRGAQVAHALGQLGGREVRPHEALLIGIARRVQLQHRLQIFDEGRGGGPLFFRAAPGRRTRPAAGAYGRCFISSAARSLVHREQPTTPAT